MTDNSSKSSTEFCFGLCSQQVRLDAHHYISQENKLQNGRNEEKHRKENDSTTGGTSNHREAWEGSLPCCRVRLHRNCLPLAQIPAALF